MFDPETGKLVDRTAIRSIQVRAGGFRKPRVTEDRSAKTKQVEIVRQDDGSTGGYHTHHGEGQVAANVFARSATAELSTRNPE